MNKYQIQTFCAASIMALVPTNSLGINSPTPSIAQYTVQDSSYQSRGYVQETEDNANFIKKALISEAKKDLRKQGLKILHEDIVSDYVEGLGNMLFCDIVIETSDIFTVKDMIELNAGIVKKHSLMDNDIVLTLHTA